MPSSIAARADDDLELRQLEAELDRAHEQLPFWSRDSAPGRFTLLAAFDSWHPLKVSEFSAGSIARAQHWKHLESGLPIAMRWLNSKYTGPDTFEVDQAGVVDAGFFLNHAADYANVVDHFEMHSRGQVLAHADATRKLIRFT